MGNQVRWGRRAAALAVVGVLAGGLAAHADDGARNAVQQYDVSGTMIDGIRLTAIGLPDVGQTGTQGPLELVPSLTAYHDSGRYAADIATVAAQAKAYLQQRLEGSGAAAQACTSHYVRIRRPKGRAALYQRRRSCTTPATASAPAKPAIVLDIDETSLSNYAFLAATGFASAGAGLAASAVAGNAPAIGPVLDIFKYAKAHGVATFFITGRPSLVNAQTQANLKAAGYDGYTKLFNKPGDQGTLQFKSGERADLEKQGYTIVENIGDQDSDLAGGHSERSFKLPNPYYFIGE